MLLAHPGTQHSFRLAAELERHRALMSFYTGLAIPTGGLTDRVSKLMPRRWQRQLANRRINGVAASRIRCHRIGESLAQWQLRNSPSVHDVIYWRNFRFQRSISEDAFDQASAVVGFDTASWLLAERCAKRKLPLVLDQTTPHPDAKLRIQQAISESYPEWVEVDAVRPVTLRESEEREYCNATRIVAASTFTRQTLVDNGVEATKIRVNPYGVDCDQFRLSRSNKSDPLRFIFVGQLSAGKGVPLLVDAWKQFAHSSAELWFVGRVADSVRGLLPTANNVKYFGAVPSREVPELLGQCDVFVFPSYFEGFGLVILEAMACGLPVITTTATAGPDIITEDQDGWIVAPGDLVQLQTKMGRCMDHPGRVREVGMQARRTAEKFTWSAYGDRWMEILREVGA